MAILTGNVATDALAIFVALIAVAFAYFKWSLSYWKRRGVQTPPPKIPFGNVADAVFRKDSLGGKLRKIYEEFKPKGLRYCGFYFVTKPIFVLLDPELIKTILTKDFQHFINHSNYVNEVHDPLSGNLFGLKGQKWKNLRSKLTPTFTSGKMKMMFQTLVDCSDEMIVIMDKAAEENTAVDIKDIVARFTTDIIGSCAFGLNCNSLQNPNSEFIQYGRKVFEPTFIQGLKFLATFCIPDIMQFFNVVVTRKDVTKFFTNVVDETVKYREANNVVRKDFMHLLIQLKNNIKIQDEDNAENLENSATTETEAGKSLTMNELTAQAFVFFLAGFETSSTTLTFCFYELVSQPEIQQKLRQEIYDTLEKHGGKITYEAIMEMTYMDKCIYETLRKHPPATLLNRECTKTYRIPDSDVVLEKGSAVFLPVYGIHHDPEYYPEPEKFDPERFSPENKAKRHAFTWLPFGEGPRVCIGLRFGVMQTKVALTILLKNYKFSLNSKTQVPLVMDPTALILSIKGGMWLNAEKITNNKN